MTNDDPMYLRHLEQALEAAELEIKGLEGEARERDKILAEMQEQFAPTRMGEPMIRNCSLTDNMRDDDAARWRWITRDGRTRELRIPADENKASIDAAIAANFFRAPVGKAKDTQKPSNPKDLIGIRKAPFSTVSGAVMAEVGTAMLEGAAKYGRHNYRVVGVRASVYYDATMRHLVGWWEGEDLDPDSGLSHVTKAIASLVVLRDAMLNGKCEDDRPPACTPFLPALNTQAGKILDRHADKNPTHYTQAGQATAQSLRAAGLDDEHDALTFGERSGSIE